MQFWIFTLTEAILIAVCISFLDLVQGLMDRYYFGFVAIMMCATYGVFLIPSAHPLVAILYWVVVLVFAVTNFLALLRFEPQLFALFSLSQLLFAQYLTQELKTATGGDSGLELPVSISGIRLIVRCAITLFVCLLLLYAARRLHKVHLAKVLTAYGDEAKYLRFFRPVYPYSVAVVTAFTVLSASVVGVLLAFLSSRVDPRHYSMDEAFNLCVLLIVGGRGSMAGAIVAPIIIWIIGATVEQQFDQPLYFGLTLQVAMIAFLVFRPTGIWGHNFHERC